MCISPQKGLPGRSKPLLRQEAGLIYAEGHTGAFLLYRHGRAVDLRSRTLAFPFNLFADNQARKRSHSRAIFKGRTEFEMQEETLVNWSATAVARSL